MGKKGVDEGGYGGRGKINKGGSGADASRREGKVNGRVRDGRRVDPGQSFEIIGFAKMEWHRSMNSGGSGCVSLAISLDRVHTPCWI